MAMSRTLLITMAMVAMVCYVGCKGSGDDPISVSPPEAPLTKEDSIIADCYLVRDAAEAYAAANNGIYATDPWHSTLPDGRILIDFLPDGKLLVNLYNGGRYLPIPGHPGGPGEIGYTGRTSVEPYGYVIRGVGADYSVIIELYTEF